MHHRRPGILTNAVIFSAALTIVSSIGLAAPNTGSGPQKTEKQCKAERDACMKACDKLIDIDNISNDARTVALTTTSCARRFGRVSPEASCKA